MHNGITPEQMREISDEYRKVCEELHKVKAELAEYKRLEEQVLLLRLPVAIGDIVYRINEYADEPIIPMGVTSIKINGITDTFKEMKCKESVFGGEFPYRFIDIGKTAFLTREEAEQALVKMKGGTVDGIRE